MTAFENELGVQAPVGFWDPAGFTADGSVENFKRRRQTELKHGRISMLATMGYITPEITGKFPGYLSPSAGLKFADVPNGLAAISKVPAAGWGQILAYMAYCEVSQDQSAGTAAAAGDFGWKVLTASDPAEKTKKLNAELANGRLAMMAIIGMFFQDGLKVSQQHLLGAKARPVSVIKGPKVLTLAEVLWGLPSCIVYRSITYLAYFPRIQLSS